MVDDEHPETYRAAFEADRAMLAGTSDCARVAWFFISDERVLLSFEVADGESAQQAEARQAVKFAAMAKSLESLPCAETTRGTIVDLRRFAAARSARFKSCRVVRSVSIASLAGTARPVKSMTHGTLTHVVLNSCLFEVGIW